MNKLYTFCALIFLTACGSPLDGAWSGTGDAEGYGIEITGEEAKVTDVDYPEEDLSCTVVSPGESESKLICREDGDDDTFIFTLSVDGDNMSVLEEADMYPILDDEEMTFVRD
jgi:hypothetical protein